MSKPERVLRTDGEATHNRILEAAGELFATTGFSRTANKMIAARAGVDVASINYHFGGREGLYQAVLVEAHRRLVTVDNLQQLVSSDLPARGKLKALIVRLVDSAMGDHAWHVKVLSREILAPSIHLQALQSTEIPAKLPLILGILSEIAGIPPDDPVLLRSMISTVASCVMPIIVGPRIEFFAEQIDRTPPEVLVEHLYTFAIGGLEAVGRDRALRPKPGEGA